MNWSTIVSLLRTTLYGWAISLWWFLRWLWRLVQRRPARGPEHRPTSPTDCVPIDHPAVVRPDPFVYRQRYLLDRGLAVTWDNPDIVSDRAVCTHTRAGRRDHHHRHGAAARRISRPPGDQRQCVP
jgi:hypothetical protein